MNVNRRGSSTTERKASPLVNLATAGFIVAWLTFACYALAYLISH